jgi:hypothetical protein
MCKSKGCDHKNKVETKLPKGKKSLAETHPEIAEYAWGWDPRTVTAGISKKMQFRCKIGHLPKPTAVSDKVKCGPKSCRICSGKEILVGFNDLATTHPEIAKHAFGWDPKTVTAGISKKMQFRCKLGHLPSPVQVSKQVQRGQSSCSICSGQEVLVGYNDLATTHPDIAKRAYGWDPRLVNAGSNKKMQFRCKLGHLPDPVVIADKVRKGADSCRVCSGQEVLVGYNDMQTTHPHLASQLVGDPTKVIAGTSELLKWKCECGYTWPARGGNRVHRESGCPRCSKTGFKPERPSFFYLIQKPNLLKLGIGNHGSGRLEHHRRDGWDLIESIDLSGHAADAFENACIAAFKSKGIPLGQFRETFPGFTESWYKHDLEVKTIRQLCRKLRVNLAEFLAM